MYKRISKKTFERNIAKINEEKKLTKRQKEWELEAYRLNNRLAAAEKSGVQFSYDIVGERPKRVTKKDIERLKSIRGKKIKQYAVFIPTKEEPKKELPEEPLLPEEPAIQEPEIELPVEQPEETEEYSGESDYYDDWYDPEGNLVEEGQVILDNLYRELGVQEDKLWAQDGMTADIVDYKVNEAAKQLLEYVEGAMQEYGKREVLIKMALHAQAFSKGVEIVMYAFYRDDVEKTQRVTNDGMSQVASILFANDAEKRMSHELI